VHAVVQRMLRKIWDHLLDQSESQKDALSAKLISAEREIKKLLDRILEASVPSVIAAYEQRIGQLEQEKLLIREKLTTKAAPRTSFDDTVRTALVFLSNPWNLWSAERFEDHKTVLKLTFADGLRY